MTTVRNLSHAEESMPYIMEFVVMCIALLNGLINPVVLMLSNRDYRKEIKLILSHRFSHSMEERSDTDSITFHSRRSHNLSKTFQSMQDVQVVPAETRQLKKQDSDSGTEASSDALDICRLQVTVVANLQECKELMSHSCRNSVDLDPQLEHVQVKGHVSQPVVMVTCVGEDKDIKINIDNPD